MLCTSRRLRCAPFLALALCASSLSPLAAQRPAPGSNWEQLESAPKRLPPRTKVHVAGDRMSRKCVLESVTDEALLCSSGHTQYTFPRTEVRSVKRTRPLRSALVGMGIGLGTGLAVGAIVGHVEAPPEPHAFLDFSDLTRDVYTLGGGVLGLAAGGVAGGTTDFLRGPTLYLRTAAATPASQSSQP